MAITYKYNNIDVFAGLSRAPLLARGEEIIHTGTNIARADSFILSGFIKRTDCDGGFEEAYELTKSLILGFANNFGKFEIWENGSLIFSHDKTIVESITIDENKYYDLIPYSIKLLCYKDSYADLYGVLDPKETYEYEEQPNKILNITHTVSARGINDSDIALKNARDFVNSLAGYNSSFPTVSYSVNNPPVLVQKRETINRFTGEVSIIENYIIDIDDRADDTRFVFAYTKDLSVESGAITVTITGTFRGPIDGNIADSRTLFQTINFPQIAGAEYSLIDPAGSLPLYPIRYTADENRDENIISFTYVYQNNPNTDPYVIDSTTIRRDGPKHCIVVSLSIKSDQGCPAERLRKTQGYFRSLDIDAYVAAKWATYGTGKRLGNTPSSKSVSTDYETGTVELQVTVCTDSTEDCGCIENLKYTLKITPAIPQFSEEASYAGEGCYYIQNLQYDNRARIEISGNGRPSKCCTNEATQSQLYTRAVQLMTEYFQATDIVLEKASIEISNDRSVISFNFSWNGLQATGLSDTYVFATF